MKGVENVEDKANTDKKQSSTNIDTSIASNKTNVTMADATSAPATAPTSNKNANEKTPSQFTAPKNSEVLPDMFNNSKVKLPEEFLKYKKLIPHGPEVPRNYVKYIEPVFDEA